VAQPKTGTGRTYLSAAQKKKLSDDETKIDFLKKDLNNKSKQ
jgi:hypothetical protein